MTDNTELKRLAEAATPGPWYQHGGIMQVLSHDCETVCETFEDDGECPDAQFIAAANPAAVLALIAENEELGRYLCTCRDCGGEGALHTGDWHSYGHMEPPEPVMEKCGECDGTGLLGEIQDLYQVITERDQLRAEVAGLKTGYEAYERVNAELKAEVGALRKLGPSKEIIWCACGDGYPVNSYGAGFMDANNGVCANCDAALGQGEQP